MSAATPHVFVSSTCFDLSEVRSVLTGFIESFGYHPVLSDQNSFPVTGTSDPEDTCFENIQKHADIFVLVVGKRSGSESSSGKSITNMEFVHARQKGIPIYVFILKEVLTWSSLWRDNPGMNISGMDSPKLMEFVNDIHSSKIWHYSFEKGSDICDTLRKQWAVLVKDMLQHRSMLQVRPISDVVMKLDPASRRLAIERPQYWEYRLFSSILRAKLDEAVFLKKDAVHHMFSSQYVTHVKSSELFSWLARKHTEAMQISHSMTSLFESSVLTAAFGPLGSPGDVDAIVYLADRLIDHYRHIAQWMISINSAVTHDVFNKLMPATADLGVSMLEDVEAFVDTLHSEIRDLINNPPAEGETRHISITLTLKEMRPQLDALSEELERLGKMPSVAAIINNNE